MKLVTGEVFSMAKDNQPVPGCTVSKSIYHGENDIVCFSLAENTDISAEMYPYYKLLLVAEGTMEVYGTDVFCEIVHAGECFITLADTPMGMRTSHGVVYTELTIRSSDKMNEVVKPGEVFRLADLVPYQEEKIVNMDIMQNEKMKFVIMAFDEGTGLSEHAAPGEAIIFALDGEGVIGYEGQEHVIKAGENFHFAKGGMHSVKATKKFKMALLLTLE